MTLWTVARQAPLSTGLLQARLLEWVAMPFRVSSQPRDRTGSPALQVDSLPSEPPGKSHFSVNFPKFFNHSRSVLWLFLPVLTITQIYGCNILAAPSRLITHLKEKSSPQDIVPYHQKLSIQTLYLMHLPTSINQSIYQ